MKTEREKFTTNLKIETKIQLTYLKQVLKRNRNEVLENIIDEKYNEYKKRGIENVK